MQPDLFTPPPELKWCWVCHNFRETPMVCSATCMEQDYPQEIPDGRM